MHKNYNSHIKIKEGLAQNMSLAIGSLLFFFILGEIVTRIAIGTPLITQPDEALFWKYKKDQVGHQKLYSPVSRVDKNGFRYSSKDFDPQMPSIYVGGDSYAWGEGVLDRETFAGQLQILLDSHNFRYNILNGGVPGYGIGQIIDRMEIESRQYKPEYAIFLWAECDIDRLRDVSLAQKKKFLRDYRLRSLFRYSAFFKIIKEKIFDKLLQKDLGFGFRGDRTLEYARTHSFDDKVKGLTSKIKDNVFFLKSRNITPIWILVTVPSEEFKDYLVSLSRECSVALIDPRPLYEKRFPGLKNMATSHSGHFRPEVYSLLANETFNRVFGSRIDHE